MLKEDVFRLGNISLNVAQGPKSGPPLLLIHGGGNRWQEFLPILPALSMRWHLHVIDLRGHGKSSWADGQYRPEQYVIDILAYTDAQAIEKVVLFGVSLGGWIALMTAVQLGDKVSGLILGDPPLNIERFKLDESQPDRVAMWRTARAQVGHGMNIDELAEALADMPISMTEAGEPVRYGDIPGVSPLQIRSWAADLHQLDPDVLMYHAGGRIHEYVEHVDIDQMLDAIKCPTLLIQADPSKGGMETNEEAAYALDLLENGLHVKLDDVGHDLGLASWIIDQLLSSLTSFLESL